jgi:dTDP-glucose pyrophosphorylase
MKNYKSHLISSSATLKDGLFAINQITDEILCLFVLDETQRLVGTLTDGDIRRALLSGVSLSDSIVSAMNRDFAKLQDNNISPSVMRNLRTKGIKLLPFIDSNGIISKVYNIKKKQSILPIDAVLMAGGKGVRLKPLTDNTPKPLLKIGDKAIIDYNIERLINYGIENIHITVNYLAEQLIDHFSEEQDGILIKCVTEPEYLGTMGSVKFVSEFINDTILVMNSDLFTNIDFEEFYESFLVNNADMAVAAIPYSVSIPYGVFELNEDCVLGLNEKPTYNYYANAGIYLVKRELLDLIPSKIFFDATDFIELLIRKGHKVIRFPLIGYWIDIGKHEDFKKVQEFAKHIKG